MHEAVNCAAAAADAVVRHRFRAPTAAIVRALGSAHKAATTWRPSALAESRTTGSPPRGRGGVAGAGGGGQVVCRVRLSRCVTGR